MKQKSGLGTLAWWLMVIGALNWGLIGVGLYAGSNWNVINLIAGSWPQVEWIIYILVGLSAIYTLFSCKKNCN